MKTKKELETELKETKEALERAKRRQFINDDRPAIYTPFGKLYLGRRD